ncbi:hypothetical protein FA95DRAFT_1576834 [Auriscalpium vulgare]|uniref:Uncharacterized protein n=1 Tax=Auriscalpium vulgare TaxID=40419 RepID=A0ACB8RAM9_9AGAM|nr:hypothetical protein FA95DRAFT_1576834 [Auriscalpium vulgare]
MASSPDPPEDDPPNAPGDTPELMNIDTADSDVIVDTAAEPPVPPFPASGVADVGPTVPSTPTTDSLADLPNSGAPYYTLHPTLRIPVHSHGCDTCTAFLTHQDRSHPSWAHVQEQFKIHQRAQFAAGVSHGLAYASERIATAEGIRRRAEENVARAMRQRDIARQSEESARDKIVELQSQLETIRTEHAALVQDHAQATQALDRARAPSRPRSPPGDASSIGSQRRRSPRSEAKKRKRSPPRAAAQHAGRGRTSGGPVDPPPSTDTRSWTSVSRDEIHGPLWDRWVPLSHDDVTFVFSRAVSDPHASARIRTLALLASDRAISDRSSVMRFLVQQWGTRRNDLVAPSTAPSVADPSPRHPRAHASGGGRAPAPHEPTEWAAPAHVAPKTTIAVVDDWTTVTRGSSRSTTRTSTPALSGNPVPGPTAQARRTKPPAYSEHIDDWLQYYRDNPNAIPPGVPVHPDNSPLRGSPLRRILIRHIEIRRNGPQGREQYQRSSRGHWVTRTTQLFSIRGLYGRIIYHLRIPIRGSIPEARPYQGDTRNISLEDVARHFASNGYQPRSLSVTEFEEYAIGRRNATEHRPSSSTTEWTSYPTLADMQTRYPVIHAPPQTAGPARNLYSNMSLDFRNTSDAPRARTPEGPSLSRTSGSMSPDFPIHYSPPTPHFVPIEDAAAEPLPTGSGSWADDNFAVNNSSVATVNNTTTVAPAVDPAALPLPHSRSVSPMDESDQV